MFSDLETKGYTIIPGVLTPEEITRGKNLFHQWVDQIPGIEDFHSNVNPHGIFRYHQVGHQPHAWFIRTNPKVQEIYKKLWDTAANLHFQRGGHQKTQRHQKTNNDEQHSPSEDQGAEEDQ